MDNQAVRRIYMDYAVDFTQQVEPAEQREPEEKPFFSFMMTIYNDAGLLNAAINSLLTQQFESWELLILDNSEGTLEPWNMIQNAMHYDSRIHGMKGEHSVGWAKGAAVCLAQARGIYTTFLAADDCLNEGVLERMHQVLCKEEPDILWVGNTFVVQESAQQYTLAKEVLPEYAVYGRENRSAAMIHLMQNVYYNAFFHYMRIDFLRKENIDFFEPYYSDCAGMTHAMAVSEKMVVLDELVYCLTMGTSQTAGNYIWDSWFFNFLSQWRDVRNIFQRERMEHPQLISYAASRIASNLVGQTEPLCLGRCRDKYMNSLKKTAQEIVCQLEEMLENEEFAELLELSSTALFGLLLTNTALLYETFPEVGDVIGKSWIRPLLVLAKDKEQLSAEQQLSLISEFLLDEHNRGCVGFQQFSVWMGTAADEVIIRQQEKLQAVLDKYTRYLETEPQYLRLEKL